MIIAIQGNVNDVIQSLKEQKSQCSIKASFKELKRKIRVLMHYKTKKKVGLIFKRFFTSEMKIKLSTLKLVRKFVNQLKAYHLTKDV